MKKLLMAVAVTLVGIAANAASVTWSVNAIQSSPDTAVGAGWLVQVYSSDITFDLEKAQAGELTVWSSANTVAAGTTFRATATVSDGVANGTSADFYAVIWDAASIADAKNYIVSDVYTATASAAGNPVNMSFGAMTATTSANKFLNSSWTATAAVPEPTSGLLMLLGMAGLALRRRRA